MTTAIPDDTDQMLTPPPAPEQDTSHMPDNDPGTDGVDPDTQGGNHHQGGE